MHIMRLNLLVQNPGIGTACVKESPDFLWRVVANVDVGYIGEIVMIIEV